MGWVFGRFRRGHALDAALEELADSPDERDKAFVCNFRYDCRVTIARDDAFTRDVTAHSGAGGLLFLDRYRDYFNAHVGNSADPDFLDPRLNGDNLVGAVPRTRELVRILDLSKAGHAIQLAPRGDPDWFDKPLPSTAPSAVVAWMSDVVSRVRAPGDKALRKDREMRFVSWLLAAMNDQRSRNADKAGERLFEPAWATTWDAFRSYSYREPTRWAQVLGLPFVVDETWILALRYRLPETVALVRPTVLDAGQNAAHYPSPLSAPLEAGGHPMDLGATCSRNKLLPEYIHRQIDHTGAHYVPDSLRQVEAAGFQWPRLPLLRAIHYRKLTSQYPGTDHTWMADCSGGRPVTPLVSA